MKKILYVSRPIAPPWDEASKNFAHNLSKKITTSNSDLEIHLMTNGKLKNLPNNIVQENIYTSSQNDFGFWQKVYLIRYLIRYTFLNSHKYDLVHLFFTPTRLTSWILKRILRKTKVIQTIATLREDLFSEKEIKKIMFEDIIVTYSEYAKNKLQTLGFNNVQRIYPGIDLENYKQKMKNEKLLEKYGFCNTDFIINFTGEYTRLNAIDDVTNSFIEISKKIPEAKLSLAVRVKNKKDKNKKEKIIAKLKEKDLLDNIAFHDDGNYEMSDIYNLCDLSLFPVRNMNGKFDIPLAVIEAMACEKPVIISDIPILKEFSNENNSIQVRAGNVKDITKAVLTLYNDKEKTKNFGNSARKYVQENFDLEKASRKYSEIYKSFL